MNTKQGETSLRTDDAAVPDGNKIPSDTKNIFRLVISLIIVCMAGLALAVGLTLNNNSNNSIAAEVESVLGDEDEKRTNTLPTYSPTYDNRLINLPTYSPTTYSPTTSNNLEATFQNYTGADFPYQAVRINDGNPIIEPSMFSNSYDGNNINGPSLIRVPEWIPMNKRANISAQYYLYFAHHQGDYIRMAWAADIGGPYTLYNDFNDPGNRGVLDNAEADIFLDNNIRIEENHLASPDVHVDDENQLIIMYFHSGSSFFVNDHEQKRQVTWVSTSLYGLEFYERIESVHLGDSYFRVFEYDGELYALDNSANINRALDRDNPWRTPNGHDFKDPLWEKNPSGNNVFQEDIPVPSSELRVRHTGVHVDGNQLLVFYSRRGELQERIQLSTMDLNDDWANWNPTYPPKEILAPNPGWEGGELNMANSEMGSGVDVNQLRDPYVFEDSDGQMYLLFTGNGEGGIGIARLYETPEPDITLRAIADGHVRQGSENVGTLKRIKISIDAGDQQRRMYIKFDLSGVSSIGHASVRLRTIQTSGGPVTAYKASLTRIGSSLNSDMGDAITTVHLRQGGDEYYEWNISDYASQNTGGELTVVFGIGPSNGASHSFTSIQSGSPAELLISIK